MRARGALGALLLLAGGVWLLESAGVAGLSYQAWVGLLLVAIGLLLVLVPGRHGLLATLGVLVALAGAPALLADEDVLGGGVSERVETPRSAAELEPYRHGLGKLTVDLTSPGLDLDGARIEASIAVGQLVVLLPDDADVDLDVQVGIGNAEALGRAESGLDVTIAGLSGTSGRQELALELDVGIGNARVARG